MVLAAIMEYIFLVVAHVYGLYTIACRFCVIDLILDKQKMYGPLELLSFQPIGTSPLSTNLYSR